MKKNGNDTGRGPFLGNYCYSGSVRSFAGTTKREWISEMRRNYPLVSPHALEDSQLDAWRDCFRIMKKAVWKADVSGDLSLVFEYVLPGFRSDDRERFENQNGLRPDVLIVGRDRIMVLEFKRRAIEDENHAYLTGQAKKYKRRLKRYHDKSSGMKIKTVLVLTEMSSFEDHIDRVTCCSPDKLQGVIESYFRNTEGMEDIKSWTDSSFSDHSREQ